MKNKVIVMSLAMLVITSIMVISFVSAMDQPVSNSNMVWNEQNQGQTLFAINQPFFPPVDNLEGSSCDVEYSNSAGYCSGDIRQYYQCLNTMQGLKYTQKSENCGSYDPVMYCAMENNAATCTSKKPLNIGLILGIAIVGGVVYFIFKKRK